MFMSCYAEKLIVGFSLLAFFAILAGCCFIFLRERFGSHRWKLTEGVVLSRSIRREEDGEDGRLVGNVYYEFSVGGREYRSANGSYRNDLAVGTEDNVKEALTHYREGDRVEVWHDPEDPTRCALHLAPPNLGTYLSLLFLGLPISFTVAWLFWLGAVELWNSALLCQLPKISF